MNQSEIGKSWQHGYSRTLFIYGVSIIASAFLFGLINYLDLHRPVPCCDLIIDHGVPFTFFREGGFQGQRVIIWPGLVADVLVAIAVAVRGARGWERRSR